MAENIDERIAGNIRLIGNILHSHYHKLKAQGKEFEAQFLDEIERELSGIYFEQSRVLSEVPFGDVRVFSAVAYETRMFFPELSEEFYGYAENELEIRRAELGEKAFHTGEDYSREIKNCWDYSDALNK